MTNLLERWCKIKCLTLKIVLGIEKAFTLLNIVLEADPNEVAGFNEL